MCLHSSEYRYDYLGGGFVSYLKGKLGVNALEALRKPAVTALKESSRFSHPIRIEKIAAACQILIRTRLIYRKKSKLISKE